MFKQHIMAALTRAFQGVGQSLKDFELALSKANIQESRYWGNAPRKIVPCGPPAQYDPGPAGDIHRERAIRRADRWRAANINKSDDAMPRHIWNNFADAINQKGGITT